MYSDQSTRRRTECVGRAFFARREQTEIDFITIVVSMLEAPRALVALVVGRPDAIPRSAILDSARVGRDAGRIAGEPIAHLAGLVRSNARVTLKI
jgi:hypothetical protein